MSSPNILFLVTDMTAEAAHLPPLTHSPGPGSQGGGGVEGRWGLRFLGKHRWRNTGKVN